MSTHAYLLALDQGTTSSRAIVFREDGKVHSMAQQEFVQIYPQPGWVEHDPMAIWHSQLATAREALSRGGLAPGDIRGLGITNQRETTVLWHRRTGQPLHHAIVWQDRRTEALCQQLQNQGAEALVQSRTGLRLDPYFSGTKLRWLLDHVPGARAQAEAGIEDSPERFLADIMAKITDRLQQDPPNDYRVGRAQGFIRACRILTNFRRLTPEELAALEDEVTLVTEKLAELRKLLD